MHYILFYDVRDDYVEKRAEFREAHLRLAREASERGELVLAGTRRADRRSGSGLPRGITGSSGGIAEADPYVINGLVTAWVVRKWATVIGERGSSGNGLGVEDCGQ